MKHYLDIRVLPVADISVSHILSTLFTRLHLALVRLAESGVGVSFPEVDKPVSRESRAGEVRVVAMPGSLLRLHGNEAALGRLLADHWLKGMQDYVTTGAIQPVPAGCSYRCVSRRQVASSAERKRARYVRRHSVSEEEALQRFPDNVVETCDLPFVWMQSGSSGQR